MSTWPIPDEAINVDDIESNFWRKNWVVSLSEFGPILLVNAESEQAALDFAIDWAEEEGDEGLLLSSEEEEELAEQELLEDMANGGNSDRYLSSVNWAIMEITSAQAKKYLAELE